VSWGGTPDRDALECLVFLYLPLIPYKTVHAFNWQGTQYRAIPIRWSWGLVARGMLRRWLWASCILGIICGAIAVTEGRGAAMPGFSVGMLVLGVIGVGVSALGWWALAASDRRNREIRRLLGPHQFGSSDPATWTDDLLRAAHGPREAHGTATFADAVPRALAAGALSRAMWAARMSTALEDRAIGEMLTDTVRDDPKVQDALAQVRRDVHCWSQVMNPPGPRAGG
jgi:hypothetical protein